MTRTFRMSGFVLGLAIVGAALSACSVPSGSGLAYKSYPVCKSVIPVWIDGVRGNGGPEMEQTFVEELLASGCFNMAAGPEGAGLRLRGTSRSERTSDGGGGGVSLGGVGVNLGKKTQTWLLALSLQEVGGGRPFAKTVEDEVSVTGVDVGGTYEGEGGTTSSSPQSADVRNARRNIANNLVIALIEHLKAQGRL